MKEPREKAIELIKNFYKCMPFKDNKLTYCNENPYIIIEMEELTAKQCALIAVDELIEDNKSNEEVVNGGLNKSFWEQVKQELEVL
jgi:hypothetical protein